ncbi:MFS transporter [Tichowtungia aerotolerans]|uniref:MFS transporter n=1 Tax=Tichowtungia aerotolerans TaxID=2697043 RepID=A0A6P1M7H5_9BACT|nr:MFS transporter [Tichowtungia aerotolerans]QHI69811.1 MFS transporter [Tichowtungia aerotolerans]
MTHPVKKLSQLGIFKYAVGDGAFSITMNGMNNFAMIYLTQILGLNPGWAGVAISIAIFWDAVTDPVMGHISDNTRTRWGRRHPYVLVGGLLAAISFFMFWTVPQLLGSAGVIFAAALTFNLMVRTALTVYMVPYTALGFEICPDYEDRARLQGVRFFINQLTNFFAGAMAWPFFFKERLNDAGDMVDGSLLASNYNRFAVIMGIVIVVLVSVCCWGTRQFALDNRNEEVRGNNLKAFWVDFLAIFKDRLAVKVFIFFVIAQFAMMLMGTTQMFVYIFYMKFSAVEKSIVHGGGMLAFAFCSLNLAKLVTRFDKKPAGFIGMVLAVFGGLGLLAVFRSGMMNPQQGAFTIFGETIHLSTLVFALLQMCWWGGCGLVVPLASSMIADVAAINEKKTGEQKNASYAAIFTFCSKAAGSIGINICAMLLATAGIVSGAKEQTPEAARNIATLCFICGPIIMISAMVLLRAYPINRNTIKEITE